MKYSIPKNPTEPIFTGKRILILVVCFLAGMGLVFLLSIPFPGLTHDSDGAVQLSFPFIILSMVPPVVYLVLVYPWPDGQSTLAWLRHLHRFNNENQTFHYRRTR